MLRNFVPSAALAALLSAAAVAPAASLVGDYHFNNNLNNSVAGGLTALTYGNGTTTPTYSTPTIAGQSNTSLDFASGAGLSVNTKNLVNPTSYSIALLVEFDDTTGSYGRIFDSFAAASDNGLYQYGGKLIYYQSGIYSGTDPFPANTFKTVVFSFDGAKVRGYLNGAIQFDLAFNATISPGAGSTNPMIFLRDNTAGGHENDPGTLARLQVYSGVLTGAEISSLDLNTDGAATAVPTPAAAAGALPLLGLLAARRLRRA